MEESLGRYDQVEGQVVAFGQDGSSASDHLHHLQAVAVREKIGGPWVRGGMCIVLVEGIGVAWVAAVGEG